MDRLFKTTAYKILELFIEHPNKDFSARGIARELGISHPTVSKNLRELEKLDLIHENEMTLYPTYHANTVGTKYMAYKREHMVFRIKESGLVDYIQERLLPSCIVLFGSCAKGSYRIDSDIDLFVEASESDLDLLAFEKKLRKNVHIIYEQFISDLPARLRTNILNGVVLYGFMKIDRRTDDGHTDDMGELSQARDRNKDSSRRGESVPPSHDGSSQAGVLEQGH